MLLVVLACWRVCTPSIWATSLRPFLMTRTNTDTENCFIRIPFCVFQIRIGQCLSQTGFKIRVFFEFLKIFKLLFNLRQQQLIYQQGHCILIFDIILQHGGMDSHDESSGLQPIHDSKEGQKRRRETT